MSKIQQIIDELEEFIDSCRFQPLSNSKIVVNKDELMDFIADLRQNVPDEVKKYQRIIANRDAILRDAQDKAEEMIKKANEMTSTLVSEHEIMQQAFREANIVIDEATNQANTIIENATAEANDIRVSAIQYTDDSLGNIQNILNTAIEGMTVKYDGVMRSLESSLEVATKDRQSLRDFFSKSRNTPVQEENREESFNPETAPQDPLNGYVENTFQPENDNMPPQYDSNMTIEDVIGPAQEDQEQNAPVQEVSDYGSVDEIKDFDLAFDDLD